MDTPLPHGLAYDSRMQIYNWFARWLKHETAPVTEEPATEPEKDQTLWVSESGSLVRSFHSETPFTLNRARRVTMQPTPLGELIGAVRPKDGLQAVALRRATWRGHRGRGAAGGERGARVGCRPGYICQRRGQARRTLLPGSCCYWIRRAAMRGWQEGGLYHTLAQRGTRCARRTYAAWGI